MEYVKENIIYKNSFGLYFHFRTKYTNELKGIIILVLSSLTFSLICLVTVPIMSIFLINYRMKENVHLWRQ
jgi:uncharacterized membrane protein YesL